MAIADQEPPVVLPPTVLPPVEPPVAASLALPKLRLPTTFVNNYRPMAPKKKTREEEKLGGAMACDSAIEALRAAFDTGVAPPCEPVSQPFPTEDNYWTVDSTSASSSAGASSNAASDMLAITSDAQFIEDLQNQIIMHDAYE